MNTAPDVVLHLAHAGVSLVVDARHGRLPSILHWGPQLGDLDHDALLALSDASVPVVGSNNVDTPPRIALVPEHHTGWTGRPGISGSSGGRGWSPRFTTTAIEWDGAAVDGVVTAGAGVVVFHATDDRGALALRLELELLASGLIRSRATLTNLQEAAYTVEDVSLCFPLPAEASELLDFTGQHNYERFPQRGPLRAGIHLRENRRGRTAADSAYVLHAGVPGFGFAEGRTWAVHTAWSGNHRHYAERVYTGEQVLGGGEVLLPGEIVLARGEEYETPWIFGAYGDGLDAIAHRFHDHLRSLGSRTPRGAPRHAERLGGGVLPPRRRRADRAGRSGRRDRHRALRARRRLVRRPPHRPGGTRRLGGLDRRVAGRSASARRPRARRRACSSACGSSPR